MAPCSAAARAYDSCTSIMDAVSPVHFACRMAARTILSVMRLTSLRVDSGPLSDRETGPRKGIVTLTRRGRARQDRGPDRHVPFTRPVGTLRTATASVPSCGSATSRTWPERPRRRPTATP
ncbi:hypothetical protein GCM10010210_18310 [Pseudonocardia hydrocarbonoxydans]|uniref:Uncharacterized protein n=1 Tax=Pseudonocardia hydrocarbonoxydans TaxID=76726 RepID=A0A4Y3WK39_9PSEU|nr:hypothetical protein PHY01_11410 [Pseudonocardia hydrocarbonoxydans]